MQSSINTWHIVIMILLGGMLILMGCAGAGGGAATPAQPEATPYNAATSMNFVTYSQGTESGFITDQYALDTPTLFVIRTQEELESFWSKHAAIFFPQPALPVMDFTQEMFIAVVDRVEPTTGYTLTIQALEASETTVSVSVQKVGPGADAIAGDALSVPYHIVRLPQSDKEFVLRITESD